MTKKIVKLAVIRQDSDTPCPFGLKIPFGCKNAGSVIQRMFPLEQLGPEATPEERERVATANLRLLVYNLMDSQTPQECLYAGKLFPNRDVVECNYGDTASGQPESGVLLGSPFFSQHFSGIGLDGLYSYPLGFYGDSNISRNLFYGIYSLQGSEDISKEKLKKLASDIVSESTKDKKGI